jgi:predicted metal-dependent peptidase
MLVYFTDAVNQQKVAINPKYVVVVFVLPDGEMQGKTVVGLTNGNIVVEESQIDVVGVLQGQIE